MKSLSQLLASLFLALLLLSMLGHIQQVTAHPGGDHLRYVAASGRDQGACQNALQPCLTIGYALKQAQKGDEIRVAEGVYFISNRDAAALTSRVRPVLGGFTIADGFAAADPQQHLTYLLGVDSEDRQRLQQQGFVLLQDDKGWRQPTRRSAAEPETPQAATPCLNGYAGLYPCQGVEFLSRISLSDFSTNPREANDVWGFVDLNDQREYALIGLQNGTAIVNVTDPTNPVEIDTIAGLRAVWRDIKVYQFFDNSQTWGRWRAYAYVTTDGANQGLQIIDLTGLPESVSLAATYDDFASAHNVYLSHVDYSTGVTITGQTAYAYIAGSNLDLGAYRILDLHDPVAPMELNALSPIAGYTHDLTTLVITDSRTASCAAGHNPCEVLVDYNEQTIDLWDVTDKTAPLKLSSVSYPNAAYVHSGWWSADKRYVFIQDESDERNYNLKTTLRLLDLADLTNPTVSVVWYGPSAAIDHNGFVLGDRYYMSNYQRGLTILDISNPTAPQQVGFFDTYPAANTANYNGAWGVYPYLPSGTILISDIERGLILVREAEQVVEPNFFTYLPLVVR